jgi:hypothetical protein
VHVHIGTLDILPSPKPCHLMTAITLAFKIVPIVSKLMHVDAVTILADVLKLLLFFWDMGLHVASNIAGIHLGILEIFALLLDWVLNNLYDLLGFPLVS